MEKYQYKSSLISSAISEEEVAEGQARSQKVNLDETVVDRFIRVVENPESSTSSSVRVKNTREDIRKKLAFFGEEEEETSTSKKSQGQGHDLQICFINEAVSDDDEFEDEIEEDSSEDQDEDLDLRSNLQKLDLAGEDEKKVKILKKKLDRMQKEVKLNLRDCQEIAKLHIEKDRLRRKEADPLNKLISVNPDELRNKISLRKLNLSALQVVVNHYHSQIEHLNEELVRELLTKDELQIEQDSQLLDIEDLSTSIFANLS